jgi:serine protease SohB
VVQFFADYGLFLAQTVTVIAFLGFLLMAAVSVGQRIKSDERQGHIEVESLNDKYRQMSDVMQSNILSETAYKKIIKLEKKDKKLQLKSEKSKLKFDNPEREKPIIFVVDFDGDIRASAGEALAEQITAILTQATLKDEVLVRLESSGGMVHSYGFTSSQLQRVRDKGISLTVCVDKVAASGGYMMACIATKLLAAPFAVIGSIGVVAQIPNFNRLLKKHDVDYEVLTAGEFKRTMTVLGENTEKGRQKFQQDIQETHNLFKAFVSEHRQKLDIDDVATGEVWFGQKALEKKLVDAIQTSDDYLFQHHPESDIYKIKWVEKRSFSERFGIFFGAALERVLLRFFSVIENKSSFFR